jgi:hypothetical protein
MVQAVAELDKPEHPGPVRHRSIVAIVLSVVVGIVLGYLGWVLPSPGGSLVVPALIVLGVGLALAGCSWIAACFTPRRRSLWIFAIASGILSVLAAAWTFWFSLPAAMWSDSGAVQQAQNTLIKLSQEPTSANGVPVNHCWRIETGNIGPLSAPYQECAISTRLSGKPFVVVSFKSLTSSQGSINYTNISDGSAFYDSCYRHLIGRWWMTSFDRSGVGNCPIGYRFHGGP